MFEHYLRQPGRYPGSTSATTRDAWRSAQRAARRPVSGPGFASPTSFECGDPVATGSRHSPNGRFFLPLWLFCLALLVSLCWTGSASAQLPSPGTPSQFDLVGLLQEATLTSPTSSSGGTLTVNNHLVVVPEHTIVILPANALSWKELFDQAPAPYAGKATGMAQKDLPAPSTTYEVHVVGNRVGDTYIAGLIYISQQDLNAGAGYINFIDYAKGEIYVGGTAATDGAGIPIAGSNPGARVIINDPTGKYSQASVADPRFTLDPDNPTIRSTTGFPMCLPRAIVKGVAQDWKTDAACPQDNRPKDSAGQYVTNFTMPDPTKNPLGVLPDARVMAPFEIGDYINYAGTLTRDASGAYISAHTITDNVAIYTWPNTNPAYAAVEVALIGTGGSTVAGIGEAVIRTRFEGMSTDPSRNIHLYGIDVSAGGTESDRDWGTVAVDSGPPGGAVKGRWRFRPPCTAATASVKACTPAPAGTFLPPTREVRAVIEGAWKPGDAPTGAGGLIAGQYHAPILQYIFPENVPGTPPPPNNFESMAFLATGGYTSTGGTRAGQLNPWPGAQAPGFCAPPTANAGADFTISGGTTLVPLSGSATGGQPFTHSWSVEPSALFSSLSDPSSLTPTFTVPAATAKDQTITFTLTVNACGQPPAFSKAVMTVPAVSATVPTISPILPVLTSSGAPVTLTARGSPAGMSYVWKLESNMPNKTMQDVTQTTDSGGSTISFSHAVPTGQVVKDVLTFSVVGTVAPTTPGAAAVSSTPVTTTVTVSPQPDADTITSAIYRTSKQRLDITASSSITNPALVLTLQPYYTLAKPGVLFDPAIQSGGAVLSNNNNGTYINTFVGLPQPAAGQSLQVKSSIGGSSPMTSLTQIRP